MTRSVVRFVHVATLLVASTGLVYGWMCYFAVSEDEFAIVNHPWQPELQHAHVLVAPVFVFALGWIWPQHVWRSIRSGRRSHRKSGLLLATLVVPMIASGYFIQISTDELWRTTWIWTHVVTSVLWVLGYALHWTLSRARGT